jgi:hypothetical protein
MKTIFLTILMMTSLALAQTNSSGNGGGSVGSDDGDNIQVTVQFLSADGQPVPNVGESIESFQLSYGLYTPRDAFPIPQLGWHCCDATRGDIPTRQALSNAEGIVTVTRKVGTKGVNVVVATDGIFDPICAASGSLYFSSWPIVDGLPQAFALLTPVSCVDQEGREIVDQYGNVGAIDAGVQFDSVSPLNHDPSLKVKMVCHFQETLSQLAEKIQASRAKNCK